MENGKRKKELPFNIEHFLDIVGDASKRSRQFLLLLIFSGILVLMAVVNSFIPKYNWFASRIQIQKNILKYITFEKNDSAFHSLSTFIIVNENLNKSGMDTLESAEFRAYLIEMDSKYPLLDYFHLYAPKRTPVVKSKIEERKERYTEIGNAINYVKSHNIYNREQVRDFTNKLDESKIEHFDIVRVPILGVSFDVNYLGVYSGMILTVLYFLLYFSLFREYISLKIAFKRGWTDIKHHHYYFYEYVSMLQVLSIPQKLFVPYKKANLFYIWFPYFAILFPTVVFFIVYLYDIKSFWIGYETNAIMTVISMGLSSIFMILILAIDFYIVRLWKKMDSFWNNQAFEFNFEYILECIGEDTEIDLLDFSDGKLGKDDFVRVKLFWCNELEIFYKSNSGDLSEAKCMKMFGQFINRVLRNEIDNPETYDQIIVDKYWNGLTQWFRRKGRKNAGSAFRNSFCQMVRDMAVSK